MPKATRSGQFPTGIDALLDLWPVFEAFQTAYVAKGLLLDAEKKRLRALADWSFGGGERYCAACASSCPDCPATLNRPQTWRVSRSGTSSDGSAGSCAFWRGRRSLRWSAAPAVIGWDLSAALALAAALGVPPLAVAELLPEIEAVMVRRLNEQIDTGGG